MDTTTDTPTHTFLLDEARGWLQDCGARTDHLDDTQVQRLVQRHYDGGWHAFVIACG